MVCGCFPFRKGGGSLTPRRYNITEEQCSLVARVSERYGVGVQEADALFKAFKDVDTFRQGTIGK